MRQATAKEVEKFKLYMFDRGDDVAEVVQSWVNGNDFGAWVRLLGRSGNELVVVRLSEVNQRVQAMAEGLPSESASVGGLETSPDVLLDGSWTDSRADEHPFDEVEAGVRMVLEGGNWIEDGKIDRI